MAQKTSRSALSRLIADAEARKFDCFLLRKLDRFGRSLVNCLNNIKALEENGVRFIAVTQRLDTDLQNPASRCLLHVLGAAAEFERALIRERTHAGQARYKRSLGKTVYSRSRTQYATAPTTEDTRPGGSVSTPTTRTSISPNRKISGLGAGHRCPNSAELFQKFVTGVWNRADSQGDLFRMTRHSPGTGAWLRVDVRQGDSSP